MIKILIVDDEERIRDVIKEYAEFEGFSADTACDGLEAIKKIEHNDYDVVVLDIMMPKVDGYQTAKRIREKKDIKILMLSARGEEYDKLFGFEMGIDDYVVKPFSPKEIMARIKALAKRGQDSSIKNVASYGGLTIDYDGREVLVDGVKAALTPKEYELLFYLVKNKGIVCTREKLLSNVWGFDFFGVDRTIDTHIKMLRSNLKQYGSYIVTARNLGYKFEVEN